MTQASLTKSLVSTQSLDLLLSLEAGGHGWEVPTL